jgi:6-bladed beta-propeller
MLPDRRLGLRSLLGLCLVGLFAVVANAQDRKPTDLPNPYKLVEGWPSLPPTMNGGKWGEVIRVHVARDGTIWVFHRCFNTVPPGHATCVNRGEANPPILQFDPSGKLLRSFGVALFAYPHAFTIDDADGSLWVSDVNDHDTVLGMSTRNKDGLQMGQEVLKLDPSGKVLMMLGKMGVAGSGTDVFDRPTGVAIGRNGDIFVTDGHQPNTTGNARVMKFTSDGKLIKQWGHQGPAPGDFDEPHDIAIGGSEQRIYVADRKNARIQVFDQDGNFITQWKQFGKAKDGSLRAFIPDPSDLNQVEWGTSASGIAADSEGAIFAADVGTHGLRKYVKAR